MPSDNYDFTPWDSPDDIEKYAGAILAGAKALGGAAMAAGKTIGAAAKPALSAAGKGLQQGRLAVRGAIKDKVTEKLGGGATEAATSGAADAAESAASAIESQKPEITSKPDTASESSMNTAQPTEPKTSAKDKAIEQGMSMVQQSMADNKQQKQNQIDRASDMARRGASVQTGEPMNIAWRLLKEDDEVPDPRKFRMNQEDLVDAYREIARRRREAKNTMNIDDIKVHPGERPKPNKLAYSKREYFPTVMRHPDQSPGIARLVMHDDNNRGTFEGLPFKDDFIRGEPLDYALDILGY
tara:strand:+ start:3902 stop:4795 length:894 start_codon:yes stop_codon:yes gene_type:complete